MRSSVFEDEQVSARFLRLGVEKPDRAGLCGCAACVLAAIRSPNAERGQLSACESMRRKRDRTLLGTRKLDPGRGYLLEDLAEFLGVSVSSVRTAAKRLGLLRKPEGDGRYAPLTRRGAKRLIQACRAR
jgi:hypothetical protein